MSDHVYLSTACLHGKHEYCAASRRPDGTIKKPASCKFCGSSCVCPCHSPTTLLGQAERITDSDLLGQLTEAWRLRQARDE